MAPDGPTFPTPAMPQRQLPQRDLFLPSNVATDVFTGDGT
ncbi:Hypothetical protein A7982_01326 [Minicystis rosea]|nr:Hypothetical protein A7982_01326 [Minicystis rosea]